MEINKTITLLKNTLTTLEKSIPVKLSDLQSNNSESRDHISTVISKIREHFVDKEVSELCSLHLCLVVNMLNNEVSNALEHNRYIGHIVGFIPKLSSALYVRCVLDLDLLNYVQETLEQTPLPMFSEHLKLLLIERKGLNAMDACRVTEKIINACVIRIKFCECKFSRYQIFEYFKSIMILYKAENSTKWLTMPPQTEEDILALGYHILSLLGIIYTILKLMCNMIQEAEVIDIYDIRLTFDLSTIKPTYNVDAKQMLQDCLDIAVMRYNLLANELDVSMFMHWHECQYKENTLQNTVGEIAHYICQLLANNKDSPNLPISIAELESMIKFLAIAPENDVENDFEQKLGKEEIQQLISQELNSFAMRHIESFLSNKKNKLDFDSVTELVMKLCSEERPPEIDETEAKNVALMALHKSCLEDLTQFLVTFVKKFGFKTVLSQDTAEIADLMLNLTEAYSDEDVYSESSDVRKDEVFKELVVLAYQAPVDLLSKLLVESLLDCHEQHRFLQLFNILKPVCLYVPENTENVHKLSLLTFTIANFIRSDFKKLPRGEKNSFIDLLVYLHEDRLIIADEFMAYCVLPRLYVKDDQDWKEFSELLELFKNFYEKCVENTAISPVILLVQFAQLLDQIRWTLDTFALERIMIYEKVADLLSKFLSLFISKEVLWKDERWLLLHVQKRSLVTKSYFHEISSLNKHTSVEWHFLSLIHKPLSNYSYFKELYENKPAEIILPICRLLTGLSGREMDQIVRHFFNGESEQLLFILDVFSTAITMTCNIAKQNCDVGEFEEVRSKRMFFCLGQLISSYLLIIQILRTDPRCKRMLSYFLTYIHRIAVALKSFPGPIRSHQYNVIRCYTYCFNSLKEVSDDLDGDVRQIFMGLFIL